MVPPSSIPYAFRAILLLFKVIFLLVLGVEILLNV